MKRFSVIFSFISVPMFICILLSFFQSCQKEATEEIEQEINISMTKSLVQSFLTASESDISYHHSIGTKAKKTPSTNNYTEISVVFPEGSNENYQNMCNNVSSIHDMAQLSHETAADFYSPTEIVSEYKIKISDESLHSAFMLSITQCKEYLHSKGMTDEEIQEMLEENEVDETTLIPFVTALSATESYQMMTLMEQASIPSYNIFPIASAFASPNSGTEQVSKETIYKVIHCGAVAIGVDFIAQMSKSNAQKWTKTIIKKLFRNVAQKMVGPAGAIIAAAVFFGCLNGIEF